MNSKINLKLTDYYISDKDLSPLTERPNLQPIQLPQVLCHYRICIIRESQRPTFMLQIANPKVATPDMCQNEDQLLSTLLSTA